MKQIKFPAGEESQLQCTNSKKEVFIVTRKIGETNTPFTLYKINPDGSREKIGKAKAPTEFDKIVFGKR